MVQTLILRPTVCMTLAYYLTSVPQFPYVENGDKDNDAHLIEFL